MMTPKAIWVLLLAVGFVLSLATLVARALSYRAMQSGPSEPLKNFSERIDSWWIMLTLIAISLGLGEYGVVVLFAALSAIALHEYLRLLPVARHERDGSVLALFVVVPVQYALIATHAYGLYSILIPVYAFVCLPIAVALRGGAEGFLRRVAETQWGLMVTVYCVSHAAALATLALPGFDGRQLLLVVFLLAVTQLSDVLQYVFGKLVGRSPIAPVLSPRKTLEGTVLGILGATLIGTALHSLTPFGPVIAAAVSLLIALLGFLGGLVMSAIKRDRGVKDWGATIPGHGGVLDRIDSLVFAAPVFFHLTRFVAVGG